MINEIHRIRTYTSKNFPFPHRHTYYTFFNKMHMQTMHISNFPFGRGKPNKQKTVHVFSTSLGDKLDLAGYDEHRKLGR